MGEISLEDFIRLMRDDPEQLMVWLRLLSSDELFETALSLRQRFLLIVAYTESEDGELARTAIKLHSFSVKLRHYSNLNIF